MRSNSSKAFSPVAQFSFTSDRFVVVLVIVVVVIVGNFVVIAVSFLPVVVGVKMSSALHSRFFSNILYSLNLLTLKSATMQEAMDPRPFCVESFPCSSNHVQKPITVVACSVVKRGWRRRRRIFLPGVVNVEASNNNCLQASLSQEVARRSVIAGLIF